MQLPKIALPKFPGDSLAWEAFCDLFRSLVHDVSMISNVQKLQYLKNNLIGKTADAVDSVPLADVAYWDAWEVMLARYGNSHILLYTHMRNLLFCPGANAKASPSEIKRLLKVTLRSLKAFKFRQTSRPLGRLGGPLPRQQIRRDCSSALEDLARRLSSVSDFQGVAHLFRKQGFGDHTSGGGIQAVNANGGGKLEASSRVIQRCHNLLV